MTCTRTQQALHAWDPDVGDLPDAIVDHVDHCDACREQLDTLWCPAPLPVMPVDAETRSRLLQTVQAERRRRAPWVAIVAAAAALLMVLPSESPTSEPGVLVADVCDPTWPIEDICEV